MKKFSRLSPGMKAALALFTIHCSLFTASCSLDYGKQNSTEDTVPELNFYGATMRRVENSKPTLELSADQLEQYKNGDFSYAKGVEFKTWNDKGEEETEGKCDLIASNNNKKQHNLFGGIEIEVFSEKMRIFAKNLMWNGVREQLISGKSDEVSIERDDIFVTGTGFSASGVSKTFKFENATSGVITTDEDEAGEDEKNSNEDGTDEESEGGGQLK